VSAAAAAAVESVTPQDLLGRPELLADVRSAARHLQGATVLVTGAGGSIGSELSRQVARLGPRRLILLGHGEGSLFTIAGEIATILPSDRIRIVLADVADAARIRSLFARERPTIVFHAAAHKHVTLCEQNVCEAVRNNVLGTRVLAIAAAAAGVAKFVMVSTDKAVNPTNVMGATKRLAEMICQSAGADCATEFVAVRFGNVLGSRGSVVPIFAEQILRGGPVTITDRRMKRFFMTIPEAVSLILAAGTSTRDGSVCVLDMGEPIAIEALAERLCRVLGREPHRDIEIVETGLRPGEKLYEELLTDEEAVHASAIDRVFIAPQKRLDFGSFEVAMTRLFASCRVDDMASAVDIIASLVPTFRPGEHWAVSSRIPLNVLAV
jgi:FlaA1/EpsC-like NDP-sugar epimerase